MRGGWGGGREQGRAGMRRMRRNAQECAGMRRNARFQKYVFHYYSSKDGRNSTPLQNHFDFICTVMKSRMQHNFKSGIRWQVSTQPENKMLKKRHQCCKKKSKREIPEKSRQWKSICLRPLSFIFSQSSVGLFSLSLFLPLFTRSPAQENQKILTHFCHGLWKEKKIGFTSCSGNLGSYQTFMATEVELGRRQGKMGNGNSASAERQRFRTMFKKWYREDIQSITKQTISKTDMPTWTNK